MDTSGAIFGTLLVILLFWKFNLEFKSIILIAALISISSLVPLFFVKEPRKKSEHGIKIKGAKELHSKLKYFIFVASIFTLANFGMYMFLLIRVKDLTGSVIISLLFYALFSLSYALFTIPFGKLSDKIGRKKVLFIGYTLLFFVALGFTNSATIPLLILLFVAYGLVYAITQSNQRALVSDLAKEKKGTAFGLYESIVGAVNIPAGLIAGLIWSISYKYMFLYVATVSILAIFLLSFVKENN